jgi:sugar transferase EpsL
MTALRWSAKRTIDVLGAAGGLIVLAPVLLSIALAVRCSLGSPVLFRQLRAGRHGVRFELLKFRTMTDARDAVGELLPDAQRLTRLGSTRARRGQLVGALGRSSGSAPSVISS